MQEIRELQERAKELRCLYRIQRIIARCDRQPAQMFLDVVEELPKGWQFPESTGVRIEYLGRSFLGAAYSTHSCMMLEPIRLGNFEVGRIEVSNSARIPHGQLPFLKEERELLRCIVRYLTERLDRMHSELIGMQSVTADVHWRWRKRYVMEFAAKLDPGRFGITQMYLTGSTSAGVAGPGSDIDLIVVFHGTADQRAMLEYWFEGWSLCLAEVARQQTGYPFVGGMLNIEWLNETPDLRHRPDARVLRLGIGERQGEEVRVDKPGFAR